MAITKKNMAKAIRRAQVERGDGTEDLQRLIDDGMWGLEGSIGRAMMASLKDGATYLPDFSARDYYGSPIPAEYMLVPGTFGTIPFAYEAIGRLYDD